MQGLTLRLSLGSFNVYLNSNILKRLVVICINDIENVLVKYRRETKAQMDLFSDLLPIRQEIIKDTYLLKGFALANEQILLADLERLIIHAPLRHMITKMGFNMSAAMTNCGALGWISDRQGMTRWIL